jgi:hypothetical protein
MAVEVSECAMPLSKRFAICLLVTAFAFAQAQIIRSDAGMVALFIRFRLLTPAPRRMTFVAFGFTSSLYQSILPLIRSVDSQPLSLTGAFKSHAIACSFLPSALQFRYLCRAHAIPRSDTGS